MKLKFKPIQFGAGRPIVFLEETCAEKMNVHMGDRVELSFNNKKLIAVVDIVKKIIKPCEVSLSEEVIDFLNISSGDNIEVSLVVEPKSLSFIIKKVQGKTLKKEEIYVIIKDIVNNALTEAEIAYFISGVYEHGMNLKETIYLTEAVYKTGEIMHWHTKNIADKHSIGGIPGNRTTPIIVSICAAVGIVIPKTSSRAITSAAGTADVIECIAKVDFPASELRKIVKKTGACLAWGGSLGLAPADDKLIRVESLLNVDPESQLLASIIAKKLAVGSKNILIDIPYGVSAKVNKREAIKLKRKFLQIAKYFKLRIKVVLTKGNQPIGNGIGPMLEIKDVIKVLKRESPPEDLEKKSIFLSGIILEMMGKAKAGKGKSLALEILNSGKAFKKFKEIIKAQNGDIKNIKEAQFCGKIKAKAGKIIHIDNKLIAHLSKILGCPIDKTAGIYLYKHKGDLIKKGEIIAVLYSESKEKLEEANAFYEDKKPIVMG